MSHSTPRIGNDFVPYSIAHVRRCGECGYKMQVGYRALASIREGKVKKIVCSEECRVDFDARFWQHVAFKNRKQRGR